MLKTAIKKAGKGMKTNQRRIKAESAARINAMKEELKELGRLESQMSAMLESMRNRISNLRAYIMIEQEAAK